VRQKKKKKLLGLALGNTVFDILLFELLVPLTPKLLTHITPLLPFKKKKKSIF